MMDIRAASTVITRACFPPGHVKYSRAEDALRALSLLLGRDRPEVVWAPTLASAAAQAEVLMQSRVTHGSEIEELLDDVGDHPSASAHYGLDPAQVALQAQLWGQMWSPIIDALGHGMHDSRLDALDEATTLAYHSGSVLAALVADRQTSAQSVSQLLITIARQSCAWWLFDGIVLLARHPVRVRHDDGGRLHEASGPAVQWADGSHQKFWHGEFVTETEAASALEQRAELLDHAESAARIVVACEPDPRDSRRALELIESHLAPDGSRLLAWQKPGADGSSHLEYAEVVPGESADPIAAAAELYGWSREEYCASAASAGGSLQGALAVLPLPAGSAYPLAGPAPAHNSHTPLGIVSSGQPHTLVATGDVRLFPASTLGFDVGTIVVGGGGRAQLRHPTFRTIELLPGTYRLTRRREWVGYWRTASGEPGSYLG